MKRFQLLLFIFITFSVSTLRAQSLVKEATNALAEYNHSRDIAFLEKARKLVDEAYVTRRDSLSQRVNLVRALVYSSLALADSARKYTYKKDPIDEAEYAYNHIRHPKFLDVHREELLFINSQLAKAHLYKSEKALNEFRYYEAMNGYFKVDSLVPGNFEVVNNLAALTHRLGYRDKAIVYYQKLIHAQPHPDYILILADLYRDSNQQNKMLEVLQNGHSQFPQNKDILFKLLNTYADNQNYPSILILINRALDLDEMNLSLNYLAGFSYESIGKKEEAEKFYKKAINLDPNFYDGNYALGLLYLNSYLNDKSKGKIPLATRYLTRANEINPNEVKVLRALVILYQNSGDMLQLQKINSKLNELILN